MVNRVFRAALLSMAACGLALAAHAQTPAPAAPAAPAASAAPATADADPVVARVNGEAVHRSDVQRMVAQLPPQVQQMPLEMIYPAVIEQLVNSKLVAEAGYKANLAGTPEVKDEIKRAEERAVQRAYIQKEVQSRITPAKLDEAYQAFLKQNPAQEEVKASHILVEKEDEAKAIIAQLKKGGDFAKLAKEKSKDPVAAEQGGDLGYFTKDTMVEPFADAAFAMKKGEVSKEPVKTQFGWHIIKVEDKRTQPQPSLDEVKPQLEQQLSKDIVTNVVDDLRKVAKVETFQLDGSPMPKEEPAPAAPKAEEPKKN
ncbi:peptidyl-prolyl cis-trans isomerase C [Azospirillum brasilense]|uniref:Parvulin-like PPIase n=1 Tax=Azospirillum brasilense TaxID=192 RepID=A0A560CN71_AZOBR|nr:peptidylprolyl isomerase [Azospirillum brasilense]MBK3733651.1 peptidylprolyl isomerase [Azospirillum brasilense]TWA86281.1 peptidyl-prolyl cis-trans isomerase C [Azospirillum brasilense]